MIGRLIGGAVGAAFLTAGGVVLAYRGYDAFLRWLVSGPGGAANQPSPPAANAASPRAESGDAGAAS